MKQILLFVATIALGFGATSCSKSDDNNNYEQEIVGTWLTESLTVDGKKETFNDCEKNTSLTFKADKKVLKRTYYTTNSKCYFSDKEKSYSIVVNKLSITNNDEKEDYTISFDGDKIILTTKETYKDENVKKERTVIAIFKRITVLPEVDGTIKKGDDNNKEEDNVKEKLLGSWQILSISVNGEDEPFEDECDKKDRIIFVDTTNLINEENLRDSNNVCKPVILNGTYVITGNSISYTINGTKYEGTFTIKGNLLTITTKETDPTNGKEETYVSIYKKS